MAGPVYIPVPDKEDPEALEENIRRFETLCRENSIEYKIHKDYFDFALPELKKETRFADLLIISSENFYNNVGKASPNDYMKEALHHSECPVIIVPEEFQFPKVNILAYDGSESSVYAIKQFAYLFPELCKHETLLVYSSAKDDHEVPEKEQIQELARQHFFKISLLKLDFDPKKHFGKWINENSNAILVSGSFGRSMFSEMFRKSFVSDVIAEHKLPVFIAHK